MEAPIYGLLALCTTEAKVQGSLAGEIPAAVRHGENSIPEGTTDRDFISNNNQIENLFRQS